jgi:anti-sigma regulatory factor (Ser/Thr protein kinase)
MQVAQKYSTPQSVTEVTLAQRMVGPQPKGSAGSARPPDDVTEAGDPLVGATLDALRRAAHDVEIEREVAETLQRSLLPTLPEVPGLGLAARYRPGSAESRIGGDWYDLIELRGGKVAVVIGDVVGRGVSAAARMAHLCSALRAYALEGLRPEVVLERMNSFVLEGERGGMVTLLYAVVDPDACTMQVASAGHPPPLVREPGEEPRFVEIPAGSPLGVTRFPTYSESVTTVNPWSTVLLYTDGLVEGPDLPIAMGLDRLREAVGEVQVPAEPDELCAGVLSSLDGRRPSDDDLAMLAFQLRPPDERLALVLPAQASSLATMRRSLARWLRAAGASQDEAYELLVACGEACANAAAHAYPAVADADFEVGATRHERQIKIVVRDRGSWRHPGSAERGRGLALMRELTDELELDPASGGTTVTMRRQLRDPGA